MIGPSHVRGRPLTRDGSSPSRYARSLGLLVVTAGLWVACRPHANAPDERGRDPRWLSQIATTCALVTSCAHGHESEGERDPSRCMAAWLVELDGLRPTAEQTCLLEAKTCAQVQACEKKPDARAVSYCKAHPHGTACEGTVRIVCGDDPDEAESVDCASLGGTCGQVAHAGGLTESACLSPSMCPQGSKEGRCEGPKTVVTCADGAAERIACKANETCVARTDDDGAERASCEVAGAPRCSSPGARYCEGDRLVACNGPRGNDKAQVSVVDCGALGLRCDGQGKAAGCYVLGPTDCAAEDAPTCSEGALAFCALGRKLRVECTSIGAPACEGGTRVACRVPR